MPDVIAPAEWTFLLYMDSPDDEQLKAEVALLKRLAKHAPWDGSRLNFIYEFGEGEVRKRGRVVGNARPELLETVPQAGSIADAITSFVDWAQVTFPSRYTALSLRDHGSRLGPAAPLSSRSATPRSNRSRSWLVPHAAGRGPCSQKSRDADDPTFTAKIRGNGRSRGGHALDGRGIRVALSQTRRKHVDVYCFDACSMGMLEFAYEVRNVAKYVVAAELLILVNDFPYEAAIDYAMQAGHSSPRVMALKIAGAKSELFSVVDTGWIEDLAGAVGALGKRLNAQTLDSLIELREQVKPTADSGVDLEQLLAAIRTKFPAKDDAKLHSLVGRVEKALKRALLSKGAKVAGRGASGLALSFPEATTIGYMLGYAGLTFGRENDWAGFLFDYIPMRIDRYIYPTRAPTPPGATVSPPPLGASFTPPSALTAPGSTDDRRRVRRRKLDP